MIKVTGDPIERGPHVGEPSWRMRKALLDLVPRVYTVTKPKGGRPKRYETAADRQRAYRARRKANG